MRLDVYPTQRVVALPAKVLANTAKNAVDTKSVNGGLGVEGMLPGVPFPIPKSGNEAMWNHLVRYTGRRLQREVRELERRLGRRADARHLGQPHQRVSAVRPEARRHGGQGERPVLQDQALLHGTGAPRRRSADGDRLGEPDRAAAPGLAVPARPAPREARAGPVLRHAERRHRRHSTYSDAFVFNGAMDRFDWKLVGKKEMYVPYNGYKLMYAKDLKPALTPNHVNPTSCAGSCIACGSWKRRSSRASATSTASGCSTSTRTAGWRSPPTSTTRKGQLYRSTLANMTYSYDVNAVNVDNYAFHDFCVGLVLAGRRGRACRTACATSTRCPSCNGRPSRWLGPASVRRCARRGVPDEMPRRKWLHCVAPCRWHLLALEWGPSGS